MERGGEGRQDDAASGNRGASSQGLGCGTQEAEPSPGSVTVGSSLGPRTAPGT